MLRALGPPSEPRLPSSAKLSRLNAAVTSVMLSLRISLLSTSPISALIDSGASDNFIDSSLLKHTSLPMTALRNPIRLELFDGSPTTAGFITHSINLDVLYPSGDPVTLTFLITALHPSAQIVLGMPWLQTTNPTIDWTSGTVTIPDNAPTAHLLQPPTDSNTTDIHGAASTVADPSSPLGIQLPPDSPPPKFF